MAKSGNFTFTNTTPTTYKTLTLYNMGDTTNYSREVKDHNASYLNTQASDSDAYEQITLYSNPVRVVPCSVEVANPSRKRVNAMRQMDQEKSKKSRTSTSSKIYEGIKYGGYIDAINVETESDDSAYRVDHPVRVSLDIIHENAATVSNAQVIELVGRLYSFLCTEAGASRLQQLRGGIVEISSN